MPSTDTNASLQPALSLDGRTAVLGILGDPVAQVKAPAPLTARLQQQGLNAVLVPMHVRPDDVAALLPALLTLHNLAGFIVTVPHKQRVAALIGDGLLPGARRANAANVVRRTAQGGWQGELLDGAGFVAGLRAAGFDPRGRAACIAGAGGAASAIAFALADAGARSVRVCDVDTAKAEALARQLQRNGVEAGTWNGREPGEAELLVNATPVGMRVDDPLPVPASALRAGLWVAEVIMAPAVTPLLQVARDRGCIAHEGRHMMERQLGLMADFFEPAILAIAPDRLEVAA